MAAERRGTNILQFENRKYSEAEFVIPSQDTKGHSERLYFRVQPAYMRELDIILASKKFPFRTQGDVGRLAVDLVIKLLHKLEPMASVNSQVEAIAQVVRDEQYYQEFVAVYESVGQAVNRYISQGETGPARKMIMLVRDQIAKMPKGYWRTKYRKELVTKFGHLVKNAGVVLNEGFEDEIDEDDGI